MACIYKILNKVTGDFYVGSTWKELRRRQSEHVSKLRKGNHHSPYLQNSWNKHGEDNFQFQVVEELIFPMEYTREYINEYLLNQEVYWIGNLNPAYNVCKEIRRGRIGRKKSQQEIDKIQEKRKGFKHSLETREKIRLIRLGSRNSEESKRKVSEKLKGKSTRGSGWKETEEQKIRRVNIVQSSKKRNPKRPFKVYDKLTMKLLYSFDLLPEAELALGIDRKIIWSALNRNVSHTSGLYFFKYKEKEVCYS